MNVRFTPTGQTQFPLSLEHIRREKPAAALKFRRRVERILRRLEEFPASGRTIPEFPDLRYREVIVTPLRFFYRVEKNTVWIVAVWHSAQVPDETTE